MLDLAEKLTNIIQNAFKGDVNSFLDLILISLVLILMLATTYMMLLIVIAGGKK